MSAAWKRVWHRAYIAALCMIIGGLAGCADDGKPAEPDAPAAEYAAPGGAFGFPIVQEPVTLRILGRKTPQNGPWKDMLTFREYEKMTGIKAEFEDVPESDFREKKNLTFATGELPDALLRADLSASEIVKYGSGGQIIPLEDLIDQYAPNYKKLMDKYPEIRQSTTAPDGHIYTLSDVQELDSVRTPYKPWINKEWLAKLGLGAPETEDDLVAVLKAFKEKDPNGNGKKDEIPILAKDVTALMEAMYGSWGLNYQLGWKMNVTDGKVDLWVDDERYKRFLQFLHRLNKEGLLDFEIFTQDGGTFLRKINSGIVGLIFIQETLPFSSAAASYRGILPIKGPYGDRIPAYRPLAKIIGAFAMTPSNKYPEATMRWIDYFYSEEGSVFIAMGIEGKTYRKGPDGIPVLLEPILNDPRGVSTAHGQFSVTPGGSAPYWINERSGASINMKQAAEATLLLKPYFPKELYGAPLFDLKTNEKLGSLRGDLDSFVKDASYKFIIGEYSFDAWDEYVTTLKRMGLDEINDIFQDAYDRQFKEK